MKTKASIVIIGIFLIQFTVSCCKSVKYYDFTEMTYELSNTIIEQGEDLDIELSATDVEFLSSNLNNFGFSNALAFDCDDGWGGMKYPFEKIEITSKTDFNNEFFANDNLSSLFLIRVFLGDGEFGFKPIGDIELEEIQTTDLGFLLSERPTINKKHSFTIKLTKSNGEEIAVEIVEITWQ